jgi:hypothetical protein
MKGKVHRIRQVQGTLMLSSNGVAVGLSRSMVGIGNACSLSLLVFAHDAAAAVVAAHRQLLFELGRARQATHRY